jgi:hypothetical protein
MSRLRVVSFTASYTAVLMLAAVTVRLLDHDHRSEVVRAASTNLDNLGNGHVETLLVSAVIQAEPALPRLLLVIAALAAAELVLGWRRTLVVFVVGHVGATLAVAVALAVGALPGVVAAEVRDAVDTGPSYGTAAVIGAGLLVATVRAMRRRGRRRAVFTGLALVGAVSVTAGTLATQPTFTAWGHLISLLVGAAVGALFLRHDLTARVPA